VLPARCFSFSTLIDGEFWELLTPTGGKFAFCARGRDLTAMNIENGGWVVKVLSARDFERLQRKRLHLERLALRVDHEPSASPNAMTPGSARSRQGQKITLVSNDFVPERDTSLANIEFLRTTACELINFLPIRFDSDSLEFDRGAIDSVRPCR
jgi:hypothetical protein